MSPLEIFLLQKEVCGYAKRKVLKKMDKRPNEKMKKRKRKDSPYSLAKDFKFQQERHVFKKGIVELG
jgi:hypothetical protein